MSVFYSAKLQWFADMEAVRQDVDGSVLVDDAW